MFDQGRIMTGAEQGCPFSRHRFTHERHGLQSMIRIKAGRGFIGKHQGGTADQGPSHGNPLLLTHTQSLNHRIRPFQAEAFQKILHPLGPFGLGYGAEEQGDLQILSGRETGQKLVGLKDHPDATAPNRITGRTPYGGDGFTPDGDLTRLRIKKTRKEVEKRAFSTPGCPLEEDLLARPHGKLGNPDRKAISIGEPKILYQQ